MKLLDTVVLVGALRENDKHHKKAAEHLKSLDGEEVFVPSSSLLELDLELKAHEYTDEERTATLEDLAAVIPNDRILPITATSLIEAVKLESEMSYFDALIVALSKELDAVIVTTDEAIRGKAEWEW